MNRAAAELKGLVPPCRQRWTEGALWTEGLCAGPGKVGSGCLSHSGKLNQSALVQGCPSRCSCGVYLSRIYFVPYGLLSSPSSIGVVNLQTQALLHSSSKESKQRRNSRGMCREPLGPQESWRWCDYTEGILRNRATMALPHPPASVNLRSQVPHPNSCSSCGTPPWWDVDLRLLPGLRGF